jgi:hypothetical protein
MEEDRPSRSDGRRPRQSDEPGSSPCPGLSIDEARSVGLGLHNAIVLAREAGRDDLAHDLALLAARLIDLSAVEGPCHDCGSEIWLG